MKDNQWSCKLRPE